MRRYFWKLSKYTFIFLVLLFGIYVVETSFIPDWSPGREGCYSTNALIGYVACPKLPAGQIIAFILNMPMRIFVYAPLFSFYEFASGRILVDPEGAVRRLLWNLMYLTPFLLGGAYPIRWLWFKVRSRLS